MDDVTENGEASDHIWAASKLYFCPMRRDQEVIDRWTGSAPYSGEAPRNHQTHVHAGNGSSCRRRENWQPADSSGYCYRSGRENKRSMIAELNMGGAIGAADRHLAPGSPHLL